MTKPITEALRNHASGYEMTSQYYYTPRLLYRAADEIDSLREQLRLAEEMSALARERLGPAGYKMLIRLKFAEAVVEAADELATFNAKYIADLSTTQWAYPLGGAVESPHVVKIRDALDAYRKGITESPDSAEAKPGRPAKEPD